MSESDSKKRWSHPYERPNDKWVCGRMEEGKPCRLGPDARGRCRTVAECTPALDLKPGEEKGRYRCTRPAEFGGPCSEGPLPDGSCAHPQPPCAPTRSWRSRRAVFTWWVVGFTIAVLLIDLHSWSRFKFINPGPVSTVHSQPRGGRGNLLDQAENCAACHRSALTSVTGWIESAAGAKPGPADFAAFARPSSLHQTSMDRACSECHREHNFHHARAERDSSCLACHQEHQGDTGLLKIAGFQCVHCHGNADYLAGKKGITVPASQGRASGIVTSFSKNHPEFALLASKATDTNTLRFNHQKHFSAEVVTATGGRLQCSSCHEQDAAGAYHKPIRFERHCQSCHTLQFDEANPQLQLPHGEVQFVQAFLASLPEQYERFGREVQGITERRALASFVQTQMRRIEDAQLAGGSLTDRIFFNRERRAPAPRVGTLPPGGVAAFYGCAFCHEVSGNAANPVVAEPAIPDRWLARGTFHHRSHEAIDCKSCHDAGRSASTSDILLPGVASCATCHNTKSSPGESCVLCHTFHRPPPPAL